MASSQERDSRRCSCCGGSLDMHVALCPFCGEPVRPKPASARFSGRQRVLLALVVLTGLLALGFYRLTGPAPLAAHCIGGEHPQVEWRTSDEKPAFESDDIVQIDPSVTPYIKLADIRTSGNAVYGQKCDSEPGHIHPPVYHLARREGANAYFNHPAQTIKRDSVEVVVTAVIAHAGSVPKAIKEQYFPYARALLIVRVTPSSAAETGGIRVNDLLVRYKGVEQRSGRAAEMQGIPVVNNETADLLVLRHGQLVTLRMVRRGSDKFGFFHGEVPILDVVP